MRPIPHRIRRAGRFGQTDDPATVVDENQIRQSFFDPNMTPPDPTPLATVTVTGTPTPSMWPLLIVLAVVGYVLFSQKTG
jgi:hypothetical protein